jgi:hypothetical protein
MPQHPSRTQRRQAHRQGTTPTKRRDPMMPVYAGVAIVIVGIAALFGIMRWQQNNALAQAYATPTPVAMASAAHTPKPIQLVDGETLGKPRIKTYGLLADTPLGGRGQNVDGIPCANQEFVTLHVHSHLSIFYHGQQVEVPKFIGMAPAPGGGCLYWIHTHNNDGIIHVEAPQLAPTGGSDYNLGIFFDIWGQPLKRTDIAGLKGTVTAYVNGARYDGSLRMIPLRAHQQIVLDIGDPAPDPNYAFPPDD